MSHNALRPRRRGLGWGIAATAVASLGILSVGLVILLAVAVDENFGWFLIAVLPAALVMAVAGSILAVVGLVLARRDRRGYAWPIAGLLLAAGQLLAAAVFFYGPAV